MPSRAPPDVVVQMMLRIGLVGGLVWWCCPVSKLAAVVLL